jgi:p-hydroxybenzoate 3-monooxygenase
MYGVSDVIIHDAKSERPSISFVSHGENCRVECDFIAGCDGFHGVSRQSIPAGVLKEYERLAVWLAGTTGRYAASEPGAHLRPPRTRVCAL